MAKHVYVKEGEEVVIHTETEKDSPSIAERGATMVAESIANLGEATLSIFRGHGKDKDE